MPIYWLDIVGTAVFAISGVLVPGVITAIGGGIAHATAHYTFSISLENSAVFGMLVTLLIRLAAIRWHLKLPTFALDENER